MKHLLLLICLFLCSANALLYASQDVEVSDAVRQAVPNIEVLSEGIVAGGAPEVSAFKAIKQPLDAPWTIAEIYIEIAIAAGILLLLILLFYWWKKRKPAVKIIEEIHTPAIPAHHIAISALNELKEQQFWQKGNIKLYHVSLSEIARLYLQNRFGFHALEKTTEEIVFSLSGLNTASNETNALIESLRTSDLVKFAKATPMAGDHEFCWTAIMEFVLKTKEVNSESIKKEVGHE